MGLFFKDYFVRISLIKSTFDGATSFSGLKKLAKQLKLHNFRSYEENTNC